MNFFHRFPFPWRTCALIFMGPKRKRKIPRRWRGTEVGVYYWICVETFSWSSLPYKTVNVIVKICSFQTAYVICFSCWFLCRTSRCFARETETWGWWLFIWWRIWGTHLFPDEGIHYHCLCVFWVLTTSSHFESVICQSTTSDTSAKLTDSWIHMLSCLQFW